MRSKPLFIASILVTTMLISCGQAEEADQSLGAIAACEQVLTNHLRSPSTYKRVDAAFVFNDPLSFAEYKRAEGEGCRNSEEALYGQCEGQKKLLAYLGIKPFRDKGMRFTQDQADAGTAKALRDEYEKYTAAPPAFRRSGVVTIKYDAVNAYNAPIRSTAVCEFGPIRTDTEFDENDIYSFVYA